MSAAAESVQALTRWAVLVASGEYPQPEARKPYVRRKKRAAKGGGK